MDPFFCWINEGVNNLENKSTFIAKRKKNKHNIRFKLAMFS